MKWQDLKEIVRRINGVSIPIFGISVSWDPPVADITAARRAITELENWGLLYADTKWEYPNECYAAANDLRKELTQQMKELSREAPVFLQLAAIREACRMFRNRLRELGIERESHHGDLEYLKLTEYLQTIGALRYACGNQIMILCVEYGINVESHLEKAIKTHVFNLDLDDNSDYGV